MDDLIGQPTHARLRAGVTVHRAEIGRRADAWIIRTPDGRHILANDQTIEFLSLLRVARTPADLAETAAARFPGADARRMVERTLAQLTETGVIEGPDPRPIRPTPEASHVRLADPTPVLEPLCGLLRRAPAWVVPAVLSLIVAAGALGALEQRDRLQWVLSPVLLWDRLPTVAALSWLLGIWHELAHAVAVLLYGGRVRGIGLARVRWRILFCVDIPDLILLPRRARMTIAAAGPAGDAVAASAAVLVGWASPAVADPALTMAAAALARIAWNLLPALRTDGAHLLSEVLGEPGLERRARRELAARFRLMARLRPAAARQPAELPRRPARSGALALYGLLSVCLEAAVLLFVGARIADGVLAIR